jgi:hypothetical protein
MQLLQFATGFDLIPVQIGTIIRNILLYQCIRLGELDYCGRRRRVVFATFLDICQLYSRRIGWQINHGPAMRQNSSLLHSPARREAGCPHAARRAVQ